MTGAGDANHEGVVGNSYLAGAGWVVAAHGELDQDTLAPLEEALASHTGTEVDYAVNLWWRHF